MLIAAADTRSSSSLIILTLYPYRTHPANEVYVTGTFDNWSKSEKLEKVEDIFQKDVTLSDTSKKIYYKVRFSGSILIARSHLKGDYLCQSRQESR